MRPENVSARDPLASRLGPAGRANQVGEQHAGERRGNVPGQPVLRRSPLRNHRRVGRLARPRRCGARRLRSVVSSGVRPLPDRGLSQREPDRGRPDLARPAPARLDGEPAPAEPHAPGPRRRSRRTAVRRRCSEGPRQRPRRGVEALRAWTCRGRVQALAPAPRSPLRRQGRGNRALHPDAPLPETRGRSHVRPPSLGDPDQRRALAALLAGRPIRLGAVLRDRPCRAARPSRPQRGSLRAHRARAPSRSEAVHPVLPPGSVPPRRRRLAHVAPAGAGGRPVPPGTGGVQPVRPGLRARLSRSRPRHCRRGAGRAARGGARCRPRRPLPPALHPVCRGPRPAAGARRALRRLRTPRQGARRRGEAQGPRRRLLGDRRPVLVGDRRPVPGGRRGRSVHRSPALRWRALRQGERPSSLPDQAGRSRHGRRHRRSVVRGGAGGSALHQLPRA